MADRRSARLLHDFGRRRVVERLGPLAPPPSTPTTSAAPTTTRTGCSKAADVYAEAGAGSFMLNLAETYGPLAGSSGQLGAAEVDARLADQRRAAEDGTFVAACNYYAYIARR